MIRFGVITIILVVTFNIFLEQSVAKILLVDDENAVQETLKKYLQIDGHEVHTASNYNSAISWLKSQTADLIVTDVILGNKTGLDLLRMAKEHQPGTPVIVITGQPSLNTATLCVKDGAFDLLEKPLEQSDFIDATRRAIKKRRRRKREESLHLKSKEVRHNLEKQLLKKDITLDRTLKDLIKSEQKYRTLVEAIPEIIMELDRHFKCIWYNSVASGFYGRTLYNRSILSLCPTGEARINLDINLNYIEQSDGSSAFFKFYSTRHDGTPRLLSWIIKPLNKPSGEIYGYMATARDITESIKIKAYN
jgi:PAS domain S-box-containing protein